MQHIISLKAQNVQRLKAIEIKPNGDLVILNGQNGEGKSSILDSILYAIKGKKTYAPNPVNDGKDKAIIEVETEKLSIKRTITKAGGGTLKVTAKDGAIYPSPQSILTEMSGALAFDPMEFMLMRPKDQVETVQDLLGLDFTKLDLKRSKVFEERTLVGRQGKSAAARFESMEYHEDAPAEEISVSGLMSQLNEAEEKNREADSLRRNVETAKRNVEEAYNDVKEAKRKLAELDDILAKRSLEAVTACDAAEGIVDIDTTPIREAIANADATNAKVRGNKEYKDSEQAVKDLRSKYEEYTHELGDIDKEKQEMLDKANFPIDGMSFGEHGVVYNGQPLKQCSTADVLRISIAMGIAMNPELGVMMIRHGSLMNEKNMELLRDMCKEHNMQVWIERADREDEAAILIEDGMVKED